MLILHDLGAMLEREGAERGDDEQRKEERAGERGDDGDGHGAEHASFKALQREHGQIDGDDDEHAEDDGARHFAGRVADDVDQAGVSRRSQADACSFRP